MCSKKIGLWIIEVRVDFHCFLQCLWLAVRNKEQTIFPHLKGNCTKMGKYLLRMFFAVNSALSVKGFSDKLNYLVGKKKSKDALCIGKPSPDLSF